MIYIGGPENGKVKFGFDIRGFAEPLIIESTVYRFPNDILDALTTQYRENKTTYVALGGDLHTSDPIIYLHGKNARLKCRRNVNEDFRTYCLRGNISEITEYMIRHVLCYSREWATNMSGVLPTDYDQVEAELRRKATSLSDLRDNMLISSSKVGYEQLIDAYKSLF